MNSNFLLHGEHVGLFSAAALHACATDAWRDAVLVITIITTSSSPLSPYHLLQLFSSSVLLVNIIPSKSIHLLLSPSFFKKNIHFWKRTKLLRRKIMSTGNKQKKDLNQQQRPSDSVVVDDEAASRRASEINTAAAILSTQGPCRQVGDIYLACVATAGLGMCRSFRANFEQCAVATKSKSREVLEQIGDQMFGEGNNNNKDDERVLQAARMINLQNLGLQPPSEDQK